MQRARFRTVESVPWRADVRQLARHGFFRAGARMATMSGTAYGNAWSVGVEPHGDAAVTFRWSTGRGDRLDDRRDHEQRVSVTWTTCHLGGRRPWWTCPGCRRRCALLYLTDRAGVGWRFACRKCSGLRHASMRASDLERVTNRVRRLYRDVFRLPADHAVFRDVVGWGNWQPPRPAGMGRAAYRRQLARLDDAQTRMMEAWLADLQVFAGRLDRLAGRLGGSA